MTTAFTTVVLERRAIRILSTIISLFLGSLFNLYSVIPSLAMVASRVADAAQTHARVAIAIADGGCVTETVHTEDFGYGGQQLLRHWPSYKCGISVLLFSLTHCHCNRTAK